MNGLIKLVIVCCFCQLFALAGRCENPQVGAPEPLEPFLERVGDKLDCYFTIEDIAEGLEAFPMEMVSVRDIAPSASLKELLANLRKQLPDYGIRLKAEGSVVVQIVARKLEEDKANPLARTLDLEYSGTLYGLATSIGKELKTSLSDQTVFVTPSRTSPDSLTKVSFVAKAACTRDILTDYVPLSGYSRILWRAGTRVGKDSRKTEIAYYGPYHRAWQLARTSVSFSEGERAFLSNPTTPEMIDSAMRCATSERHGKEATQVRWSMLWLGKNQVKKAIPALIERLDYRYTKSGLILEDYPAVAALAALADPEPLIAAVKEETDDKRRELLLAALFFSTSKTDADKLIKSTVAATTNPSNGQLIEKAWSEMSKSPPAHAEIVK